MMPEPRKNVKVQIVHFFFQDKAGSRNVTSSITKGIRPPVMEQTLSWPELCAAAYPRVVFD